MLKRKVAFLIIFAVFVTVTSGCVPATEHRRVERSLQNQIDRREDELAEARERLDEMRRGYEQKSEELDTIESEAAEMSELLTNLRQAQEERERNFREMEELVQDISGMRIDPRAEGDFIVIEQEILFDAGEIELKESAMETIQNTVVPYLAGQLEDNPEQTVRIDGHTDGQPIVVSPWEDNYHLSVMRAHAVMTFLTDEGIPSENLFLAGYGPNRPIVTPSEPEESVAENRRVEILLEPERDEDIQRILEDFVR